MEEFCLTWSIVQFLDDLTVEAVPSSWIQGDNCYWPTFSKSKLNAAITKCESLNTCWPVHKVKIFRNATFGDYLTARKKAKLAEDTSDLNTDECETGTSSGKRKRMQKILSSSSSESDELITPPKRIVNGNQQQLKGPVMNKEQNIKDNVEILIQQNHIIRGIVTDILSEVREIKKKLNDKLNNNAQTYTTSIFNTPGIDFPINEEEQFQNLEKSLDNEDTFENTVTELSKLGGSSSYDLIKRALSLIMTNEYTLTYSWLGRKGKKPFHNLNMAKVLIRAVDQGGLSASQKETEVSIQNWLRRASDRRSLLNKNNH
ncbi:hypothetical protein FQR65_LT13903 [Abscondita terminalis]|nr:hypothetical protein FQR65_LT13903 [Abscondita terminalis]